MSPCGNEYKRPSEVGMGIDWMTDRAARGEAIPPTFTQWLGRRSDLRGSYGTYGAQHEPSHQPVHHANVSNDEKRTEYNNDHGNVVNHAA